MGNRGNLSHIAEESLSAIQFNRLELTRQLEETMKSATTVVPETT